MMSQVSERSHGIKIHWAWVVLGSSFITLFITYSIRIGCKRLFSEGDDWSGLWRDEHFLRCGGNDQSRINRPFG
jgi:hypothetical protein